MQRWGMIAAVVLCGGLWAMSGPQAAPTEAKEKVLRHVVLFKFRADAKPEQVDAIVEAFAALPKQIDVIQSFEWGLNNSPEGLNKGLTHCFLLTFKDERGRDAYLPHAAHKAFVEKVKPIIEDATVVDYWTTTK